jgi:type IV pilus assembly protein PilZ
VSDAPSDGPSTPRRGDVTPSSMPRSAPPPDKLLAEGVVEAWNVDCETEDTFLFAPITNIAELGIFVRTDRPRSIGTMLELRFEADGLAPFTLIGRVRWVNHLSLFGDNLNPGMGIVFDDLQPDDRERVVAAIRTIAYLRGDPQELSRN